MHLNAISPIEEDVVIERTLNPLIATQRWARGPRDDDGSIVTNLAAADDDSATQ